MNHYPKATRKIQRQRNDVATSPYGRTVPKQEQGLEHLIIGQHQAPVADIAVLLENTRRVERVFQAKGARRSTGGSRG
jgi:hypothetical protein